MLALIALAMAQAVATPPADPVYLPIPMTQSAWGRMTAVERLQYADATIQGLRRNPVLARCRALTPAALVAGVDVTAKTGEPLMMTIAAVSYGLC